MADRFQASTSGRSTGKFAMLFSGTVLLAVGAGVYFQFFHAEEGEAGVEDNQAGSAQVHDQPAARVGNSFIPRAELERECVERHGKEILESLINRHIILQACQDAGVQITSSQVNAEVTTIAKKFNLTTDNFYKMLEVERNVTPMQYQRDIIWPMLALKALAGEEVEVTQEDIAKAFERDYGPRVKARMIMLDNLRRAQEVQQQADENPENFERLARDYSIEPSSKSLGGTVPPIRKHVGSPAIVEAAFKLQPGEISPIIQVGDAGVSRYVILLCEGQTEQIVKFEEVQEQLVEQIKEEKVQESVARVFEKLKKEARVDNYLTNTSTNNAVKLTSGEGGARPRSTGGGLPSVDRPVRSADGLTEPRTR